jgi:hypothetical protein
MQWRRRRRTEGCSQKGMQQVFLLTLVKAVNCSGCHCTQLCDTGSATDTGAQRLLLSRRDAQILVVLNVRTWGEIESGRASAFNSGADHPRQPPRCLLESFPVVTPSRCLPLVIHATCSDSHEPHPGRPELDRFRPLFNLFATSRL